MPAKRYLVRGRVQGVGYRFFARQAAQLFGIRGCVRNLSSGDVEVYAEGDDASLRSFRDELQRGPRFARVMELTEEDLPVTGGYSSFSIRG